MDAFCRRNDHASGKRPESRVIATNPAVIRSEGGRSSRPIEAVSWIAKTRIAAATPASASARTRETGEIFSTSEAPKQWHGAVFERARLTASAAAKMLKRMIAPSAARAGTSPVTSSSPSPSSAAISAPPTMGAKRAGTSPYCRTPSKKSLGARTFSTPASRHTAPRLVRNTKYVTAAVRGFPLARGP
jgi:hypothetical protein